MTGNIFTSEIHLESWVQSVSSWLSSPSSFTRASNVRGFPHSSVGEESACIAGDPGLIPGLGRFSAEGIGYPLQYSWTFLVAQLVKNPPAMWETWVWSLGWEDPLEKGKATHCSILAWRIPWTVLSMGSIQFVDKYSPENSMDNCLWGRKESDMTERLSLLHFQMWTLSNISLISS